MLSGPMLSTKCEVAGKKLCSLLASGYASSTNWARAHGTSLPITSRTNLESLHVLLHERGPQVTCSCTYSTAQYRCLSGPGSFPSFRTTWIGGSRSLIRTIPWQSIGRARPRAPAWDEKYKSVETGLLALPVSALSGDL